MNVTGGWVGRANGENAGRGREERKDGERGRCPPMLKYAAWAVGVLWKKHRGLVPRSSHWHGAFLAWDPTR